jgi:hypothetical protein
MCLVLRIIEVAGIACPYSDLQRMDDRVIEPRWGRDFPVPVQTGPAACVTGGTYLSPEFMPWSGVDHRSPNSAKVKERVET